MTMRETLQSEIAAAEADLAAKKDKLAKLGSASFLDSSLAEIKTHVLSIWGQLFGSAPAPVVAPQPEAITVPAAAPVVAAAVVTGPAPATPAAASIPANPVTAEAAPQVAASGGAVGVPVQS